MENTERVLFEEDVPVWFVAQGDQAVGPLTATDVFERIQAQEISWAHFIWKQGEKGWARICDVETFKSAVPEAPNPEMRPVIQKSKGRTPPELPKEEPKLWFLYYSDAQYGPFTPEEIQRLVKTDKISGRTHAWREGMPTWDRLENVADFSEALKEKVSQKQPPKRVFTTDQRQNPRRPLVAKVVLAANDASVMAGVCRDISIGGMQILMDQIPGPVGTKIKINVSATGETQIRPFVAEGVVVRILEDGRGFSFRFKELGKDARESVEQYISSST